MPMCVTFHCAVPSLALGPVRTVVPPTCVAWIEEETGGGFSCTGLHFSSLQNLWDFWGPTTMVLASLTTTSFVVVT